MKLSNMIYWQDKKMYNMFIMISNRVKRDILLFYKIDLFV